MHLVRLRDARSMVNDAESTVASERDIDLGCGRRMTDGVLHQVACDLRQRFLGSQHHKRLAFDIECQADVFCGGHRCQWLGGSAHDACCIKVLQVVYVGSLQPGQAEKLSDNAPHALGFPAQDGDAKSPIELVQR